MPSELFEQIIGAMRSIPRPNPSAVSIETMRQGLEMQMSMVPVPDGATSEPVEAAGVPSEWARMPESGDDRTIFYLHGGGYCLGSPKSHRALVSELAGACRARALSVGYRLAPEHPHPAALEDSLAAYRWLLDEGTDPRTIAIGGDSAGGGLTFATLVALRDAGDPLPATAFAFSPWVDLEGIGESMTSKADVDPMVSRDGLLTLAKHYRGQHGPRTPAAAPLYADLQGLPPTLIQVGTAECLLDDATRMHAALRAAGVDATIEAFDDMIHVFQAITRLPEAGEAIDKIAAFVGPRLAGAGS